MSNIYGSLIFDYLNSNPHKFDEHGNFNPSPDPRDFWPLALGKKYPKTPKPKRPRYSGMYRENEGADDVAQERNRYAAEDFENGIRYDSDKCHSNWNTEKRLCKDGKYTSGCWDRARERFMKCKNLGHYDGLPIWTYQDEIGQPQGDKDPDRSAKDKRKQTDSKPEGNSKPEDNPDQSERAMAGSPTETFLRMNPLLLAYLAANPEAAQVLRDSSADLRALLRNFVLMPSDYPKGMEPASPFSPPPHLLPALGGLMGPLGGPAAMGSRLPAFMPR